MLTAVAAVVFGLALLVWSADRFVEGAAATARHFGMPPLLIGMVIVGFGTSAPEMVVSAISALQGNPGIALGNAYGSNITNIALILGITALISPITVHSQILRKELPILTGITILAALQLIDGEISRFDAVALLVVFALLMGWTIYQGMQKKDDALASDVEQQLAAQTVPLRSALLRLIGGLVLLVISSRVLVWGAVDAAGTGLLRSGYPQRGARYCPGQCTGVKPLQHPGGRRYRRLHSSHGRRAGSPFPRRAGDGRSDPVAVCARLRHAFQGRAHQSHRRRAAGGGLCWLYRLPCAQRLCRLTLTIPVMMPTLPFGI